MSAPAAEAVEGKLVTTAEKVADLKRRLELAKEPGSPRAIAKREAKGLPSPRQRIDALLDAGSFVEFGALCKDPNDPASPYGDGVVTGYGLIDSRPVVVYAHDMTVQGGSVGEMFGRKVLTALQWASKMGCPAIGINDSGGARVQDAVTSLSWYAKMAGYAEHLAGIVAHVSLIFGKCAGGAVYGPINTDLVVAVRDQGYMFVTGPEVIKAATGEETTMDELGSAENQGRYGNVHHVAESEADAFAYVRSFLSFLPSSTYEKAPLINPGLEPEITDTDFELDAIIPDDANAPYDMHEIIMRIFDDGDFLELYELEAQNIITGFARVDGRPVGVVANQPNFMSGVLDIHSGEKATRFIRLCYVFGLPLVFLVDTPGLLPGVDEEKNGTIRRSGRMFFAYVEAQVPKVTIVIRKAYGGAYAVMGCKQLGADLNFAWPTAKIAVLGAEPAIDLIRHAEIEAAGEKGPELRKNYIDFYNDYIATPYIAAERGYIDALIEPHDTRLLLRGALRQLRDKSTIHIPRPDGAYPFAI
jgi:acetyl-CoA carboxylase carboxyltransferase component